MGSAVYRSAFISSVCCGAPTDRVVNEHGDTHYCSACSAPTHPGWDQRSPLIKPEGFYLAPLSVRPAA